MAASLWRTKANVARRSVPVSGSNDSTVTCGNRSKSSDGFATSSLAAKALPNTCDTLVGFVTAILSIRDASRTSFRAEFIARAMYRGTSLVPRTFREATVNCALAADPPRGSQFPQLADNDLFSSELLELTLEFSQALKLSGQGE